MALSSRLSAPRVTGAPRRVSFRSRTAVAPVRGIGFDTGADVPPPSPQIGLAPGNELSESEKVFGLNESQFALLTNSAFGDVPSDEEEIAFAAKSFYSGNVPVEGWTQGSSRVVAPVASAANATMRMGSFGYGGPNGPVSPPPDLPSLLLDQRILYLGMPLVPAVTELIIAELLHLGYENSDKPVFMYINSEGSTQGMDKQVIAFESEAFAILDTMRYIKPQIQTLCLGKAYGNAAMLLANGDKGYRNALPHAQIQTCGPRMNRTAGHATVMMNKAVELHWHRCAYALALSMATGKTTDEMMEFVGRSRTFTPETAKEFGLIDNILESKDMMMEAKNYEKIAEEAGILGKMNRFGPPGSDDGPELGGDSA
ncbi:ATP-dependent Clp protease proteolytic subunit [Pseudoscourfieldia marina]